MRRALSRPALIVLATLCAAGFAGARIHADEGADPAAAVERAIAAAEESLRADEREVAESRYRAALLEGWLLLGALEAAEGRLPAARDAFVRASGSAVETRRALTSLALAHLQLGEYAKAVDILGRMAGRHPKDLEVRRLLAQARVLNGQPEQAVQDLEEAHAADPADLELAFMLATGYLRLKRVDRAEPLFAIIAKERAIPQTRVLIGRAYRDAGEFERATKELRAALAQDPTVRRAHYYLGMVAVLDAGVTRLEEAIVEFRKELALAPRDPVTNLRLGMALVEAQRPAEALPHLDHAVRSPDPPVDAFHYLGRCLLALDRAAEAIPPLRRAVELVGSVDPSGARGGSIHYQLALALRTLGQAEEAATHFAEAQRSSAERAEDSRESLARYLAGSGEAAAPALLAAVQDWPLSRMAPEARSKLHRRATVAVTRAYLNLGILQAQVGRFDRAASLFEEAAGLDPEFDQVQYSLGVARFNARQFENAVAPLSRALAAAPGNAGVKRMLALAYFGAEDYARAASLLGEDPERNQDPSLQYTHGLALVRSDRAAEAQAIFGRLLAHHGESPELNVVLGQAHAQQGDYPSAIESLQRALRVKPDTADANGTLGVIYLKQGRLPEAESSLRAELAAQPGEPRTQHHLATALDLMGRPEEALPLLRAALRSRPNFADARYLLGKVLLAQGEAADAALHLEAAARLSPEDPNIHYQLGQAYGKLGRPELAQRQFDLYQAIKDKRRGGAP